MQSSAPCGSYTPGPKTNGSLSRSRRMRADGSSKRESGTLKPSGKRGVGTSLTTRARPRSRSTGIRSASALRAAAPVPSDSRCAPRSRSCPPPGPYCVRRVSPLRPDVALSVPDHLSGKSLVLMSDISEVYMPQDPMLFAHLESFVEVAGRAHAARVRTTTGDRAMGLRVPCFGRDSKHGSAQPDRSPATSRRAGT